MDSGANMQTSEREFEVLDQTTAATAKSNDLPSVDEGIELPESKPFAVVIPFASSAHRLENALGPTSQILVKEDDLGIYLQKMPNEILIQIFGFLPAGGEELKTIRLLNNSFATLAKPAYFHTVKLPRNLDSLRTAVNILAKEDISIHIREIRIRVQAMVPRKQLTSAGYFNHRYSLPAKKSKVLSWCSRFTILLMKLFLAVSKKLQGIRLSGVADDSTESIDVLEKAFANSFADMLCAIRCPELRSLHFNFTDLTTISRFYKLYSRSSTPIMCRNMGRLQELVYRNKSIWLTEVDRDFMFWVSQLSNLEHVILSTVKEGGSPDVQLTPLANVRALKTLRLRIITVDDSLSTVLMSMDLEHLELYFIRLKDQRDRWEKVCQALMSMSRLENIQMELLDYIGKENCGGEGLCSPYDEDRRSYDKFKQWARERMKAGKMKQYRHSLDLGITCNCLDDYSYIRSDSEDGLDDLDTI